MIIDLDAGGGDGAGGGVVSTLYSTDFEGPCPNGWTLSGDWECGPPSVVGPPAAFSGTQCIATQIAGNYHDNDTWATTTATSPSIDLTMAPAPKLTFRMWMDSEGAAYDGANLRISTDNGVSYSILNTVVPAYPLVINGEAAWGGHQAALGWQLVQADLSAYAGQIILLRFAFRSDTSSAFPGIYIDDVLVTDN